MRELPSSPWIEMGVSAPGDSAATLKFLCCVILSFSFISALMIGALMVG